jgi:hypothetical protein
MDSRWILRGGSEDWVEDWVIGEQWEVGDGCSGEGVKIGLKDGLLKRSGRWRNVRYRIRKDQNTCAVQFTAWLN